MTTMMHDSFKAAQEFELILDSQKDLLAIKAWRITYFLAFLFLITLITLLSNIFLQDKELVLIRVDNRTGEAEVLNKVTSGEVAHDTLLARFFVTRYISLRESYDHLTLSNDYELVQLYSDEFVAKEYRSLYDQKDSPFEKYKQNYHVRVDIASVNIEQQDSGCSKAAVRFRKTIKDMSNLNTTVKYSVANIVFTFNPAEELDEQARLANPLGFKVLSYNSAAELIEVREAQ